MATILSQELLQTMIGDKKYCSEFSFFCNPPVKAKGGCGRCGRRGTQAVDWNQLKKSVIGMPDDRKNLMKQMLGISSLKVWYLDARGSQQNALI